MKKIILYDDLTNKVQGKLCVLILNNAKEIFVLISILEEI